MAKKLMTLIIAITMIACSSISVYATEELNDSDASSATAVTAASVDESKEVQSQEKVTQESTVKKSTTVKKKTTNSKYKKGLAAYIRYVNPNISKSYSLKLAGYFIKYGKQYDVNPKILMGLARTESNFRTKALSPTGMYKGMMQMNAAFARNYGYSSSDLFKPEVSIKIAAKYIGAQKKHFGSYTKALAAYNCGGGAVASGHYSTALSKRVFNIKHSIESFLKRNHYV